MVEREQFTIGSLLKKSIDILGQGDYFNPLLDAQILLMHLLDVDKIYLYTHSDEVVDQETVDKYLELIDLRKSRYPLQYIIGTQEFMGLDFNVREGVLIPRPDTEVLIENILEIVNAGYFSHKEIISIADIGTGSGAITLSLAHFIKNSFVHSVDISADALCIAKENADNLSLKTQVKFLNGSLLEPLYDEKLEGKIDILVSNPPYICTEVIEGLQREVSTYEPKLALDGGVDGLDFYRKIIDGAAELMSENSIIAFEIGYDQGETVKELLVQNGNFNNIRVITDLYGHNRVIIGDRV